MTKPKRKLIASACLILSAKLNDVKGAELSRLIQVGDNVDNVYCEYCDLLFTVLPVCVPFNS